MVRLRTARASCTRWRSPVESVALARSRLRYPSPSWARRSMGSAISEQMASAIGRSSAGTVPGTRGTQAASSSRVIAVASVSVRPSTTGPRAASESRVPPQSGHTSSRRNLATRASPFSSFALARAFSTV